MTSQSVTSSLGMTGFYDEVVMPASLCRPGVGSLEFRV